MKINFLIFITTIFLLSKQTQNSSFELSPGSSVYYQEKYFRFLANNYEEISQGDSWRVLKDYHGLGFQANENFGSFILVKDWSMYSFKLTKVIFRPFCSYSLKKTDSTTEFCDAEMLLIHTIDNGYYPPGRRIYLGKNYLVISVPFKKTSNDNPSTDKLFHFMSLDLFKNNILDGVSNIRIAPFSPIKLHQIIQHQPSYLFEGPIPGVGVEALHMVFSQFHYISSRDYDTLAVAFEKVFGSTEDENYKFKKDSVGTIYRNWDNSKELEPKATLMAYNSEFYYKISKLLLFAAIVVLI